MPTTDAHPERVTHTGADEPMDVAVIGTGHVGLITSVSMAIIGHRVVATDIDHEKIERLTRGEAPFFEPGLEESLGAELSAGRLRFTPEAADAVGDAEVVFICVGTPPRHDGGANLIALEHSATAIARHASRSAGAHAPSPPPWRAV